MKKYIPIEVLNNKKIETWYLDITKLNYSDLTSLRKQLKGNNDKCISMIDYQIFNLLGNTNQNKITQKQHTKKLIKNKKAALKNYGRIKKNN